MKTSVCLAVVISVVVIQLVNAQDATSTNLPATTATPICEEVMCMVGCERVNGPDRCPTCYCPTNCSVVTCSDGFECELVPSCVATRCTGPRAICVPIKTTAAPTPCPVYKCADGCIPTTGPDGCPTCVCNRTCKDINCTKDEQCVLKQIFCPKWVPCFPIPTCVPRNDTTTAPTIPDSSAKKCEENISCRDECRVLKDYDGCQYCDCPLTCDTVRCRDGYVCEMQMPMPCSVGTSPCPRRPVCVPAETTAVTTPCPVYRCAEGCIHGTGPNGCPTCVCNRTCKDINCTKDEECVLRQPFSCSLRWWVPCSPRPTCVPRNDTTTTPTSPESSAKNCEENISCRNECRVLKDYDGCQYCDCPLTCETVRCRDGYVCEMQMPMPCPVGISPCPRRPVCVPTAMTTPCPMISCESGCVEVRGSNGCMTCSCRTTCGDVNCTKDEECDMIRQDGCQTPPCPHTPTCVPRPDTCPTKPPCQLPCSTEFKKDENGCVLCECNE